MLPSPLAMPAFLRDGLATTLDPPPPPPPSTSKSRFDIESLLAKPDPARRSLLAPSSTWTAAAAAASSPPTAMRFGCPVGVLPFPAVYLAEQPPALFSVSPHSFAHHGCKRQGMELSQCAAASPLPWRSGGPCKMKRVRTVFTPEQLERLEKEFLKQQYMVGTERVDLAATLRLSETQVKVWFQNRRIKWRKQSLEQKAAKLSQFGTAQPGPTECSDGQDSDEDYVDVGA